MTQRTVPPWAKTALAAAGALLMFALTIGLMLVIAVATGHGKDIVKQGNRLTAVETRQETLEKGLDSLNDKSDAILKEVLKR